MTITTTTPGPSPFATTVEVSAEHPRDRLADDVAASLPANGDAPVQVWLEDARDGDADLLAPLGLRAYRDLLQLRCRLPAAPSGIETRAFDVDRDADDVIATNNRAFAWHPEQGGMDRAALDSLRAEPWFDADGFRIHERDGRLAGFCWTKIHPARPDRGQGALGEIFVIAVDPDFHGRGLGVPTTLAGLEWLAGRGLDEAMLYVEADNVAALRTYDRIGFVRHSVNRAFRNDP